MGLNITLKELHHSLPMPYDAPSPPEECPWFDCSKVARLVTFDASVDFHQSHGAIRRFKQLIYEGHIHAQPVRRQSV